MTQLEDRKLGWWNPTTGQSKTTSHAQGFFFDSAALSPDGRLVAAFELSSRNYPVVPEDT